MKICIETYFKYLCKQRRLNQFEMILFHILSFPALLFFILGFIILGIGLILIDNLPKFKKTYNEICPMCFESKTDCKLSCGHGIHLDENCFIWILIHRTCPICRKTISDKEINLIY